MSFFSNLPYEWVIGLRYTRAGKRSRRNSFISFISLISVTGIALGVGALIVVLSVMNGFEKEVTQRMLSVLAHVEVYDGRGSMPDWQAQADAARRNPEVRGVAPFVEAEAMLVRDETMKPVAVRGVLPELEPQVSDIAKQMRQGRLDVLRAGSSNIVLGSALARSLGVSVGERITLMTAAPAAPGQGGIAGVLPQPHAFTVAGIFEAGHYQFDSTLAFVHLADAEGLAHLSAPSGLRLRLADMYAAPRVAVELKRSLPGELYMRDWTQVNVTWFAAVQSQKRMMFVILAMIVAVAAFNLVSTLVMTVRDKRAEVAILRTLGASPGAVMRIFMVQGTLVGLLGTLIGVALGVLVAFNVDVIVQYIEHLFGVHFLDKDIYFISEMPSDVHWDDVAHVGGVAVLLAFVATLYPSWSAARVNPAEALRYE
jgi:lipoprotein-releasing system permease protein